MSAFKLDYSVDVNKGGLNAVLIKGDEHLMNWVESKVAFGTFYGKFDFIEQTQDNGEVTERYNYYGLTVEVKRFVQNDRLVNEYNFINGTAETIILDGKNIGIAVPFNDNYESAAICEYKRCHQHIWAARNVAYIAAKRMDGSLNNVGMAVIKGSVRGYAVERGWNSNDRGDTFFLLETPNELKSGESFAFAFELLAYSDFDDFYSELSNNEQFISIKADKYSAKIGDKINVTFAYSKDITLKTDLGDVVIKNGVGKQEVMLKQYGDNRINVSYGDYNTYYEIFAHEGNLNEIDKRINFIIDKQAVKEKGVMYGAFMLYDNELNQQYIENKAMNDRGPARERMGMVISMMERVMNGENMTDDYRIKVLDAIKKHIAFIDNYIVKDSGKVCEAPKYKTKWYFHRLYNYSWAMLLYVTAYELFGELRLLNKACNIAREYYRRGGNKFYAINLPFNRIVNACKKEKLDDMANEMKELFLTHGSNVVEIGINWPAHEVKYEQSIVAPSVDILLECYNLSGEDKYLDEAKRQMPLLMAFNGVQPSFHNNEVAIRHWDGFWFGKKKMYGDTFPHYWSCITAGVYSKFAQIIDDKDFQNRADKCLDNNLCLIQGGRGACAYVAPTIINGKLGAFYDPWANDQDWLMWFNLRYNSKLNAKITKA